MVEHHDALLIEIMDTYKPHLKIYSLRLKTWQTVLDIYNQRANTNYKQTRTLKNRFLKLKAKLDYQDPHLSSLLNGEENVVLLEKLVAEHVAFQDKRMPGYYTKAEKDELRNGTHKHYHGNNINTILNNNDNNNNNNNNNNVTDNGERKRKLNNTDNNTRHDIFNDNHDNISQFPLSKQQQRHHKNTEQKHSHTECFDTDEFGTPMELHLREKFDNEENSEDENKEEEKKESSRKIENENNNPTSNSDNNYIMERDSVEAPPLDGITILPHTEYQKQHQNDSLSSTGSAAARQDSMTNTNVSFSPTYETQSNSYNNNNNNNNNSIQSNDEDCDNINSPISIIQNRLLHKANQANQNLFTTTAENILQEILNLINNKNYENGGKIDINTVRSLIRSEIKSELEPIMDAQKTFKNTVLSEIENIKKLLLLLTNNSLRSYSNTTDNSTSSFSEKYTKEST